LGHARISTTATFTACGATEIEFMAAFWRNTALDRDRIVAEIDLLNRIIRASMRRLRVAHGLTRTELGAYGSVTQQKFQNPIASVFALALLASESL